MADTAGYPTDASKSGLGAHSDSVHTSNKRKREPRDQGTSRPPPNAVSSNDLSDQATASFLVAHNEEDMQQQFDVHQNGGANNASIDDTATAALAYHQMTVPQATELSFQPQNSEGSSFGMGDHSQQQGGMQDYSLEALKAVTQTSRQHRSDDSSNSGSHKPPVGSDEWHKVRRDNHKEGKVDSDIFNP
jgi:hypothetical protein